MSGRSSRQASSRRLICDYCKQPAELVDGRAIYDHRPDLASKRFWLCAPCGAWVGCHPGTSEPLGRLADKALRWRKQLAHAEFDTLWKRAMALRGWSKTKARSKAYQWLASQMAMDVRCCHIGMFSIDQCDAVIRICKGARFRNAS